jgi:hypothetical protein
VADLAGRNIPLFSPFLTLCRSKTRDKILNTLCKSYQASNTHAPAQNFQSCKAQKSAQKNIFLTRLILFLSISSIA